MGWIYFNEEYSLDNCYYDFVPQFVRANGYLPKECRECCKALIFWDGAYSKANTVKFNKMIEEVPLNREGKYNDSVVVFYLPSRDTLRSFIGSLRQAMQTYSVKGRIQWAVSGAYWRREYPQFFASAKELKPITVDNEISIKDWLSQTDNLNGSTEGLQDTEREEK